MRIKSVLLFAFLVLSIISGAQTWHNPIELSNEWELYGIGDPYLLKYNGRYYLYCSTRDDQIGVKCWSSRNLVDWTYEGLAATESLTIGAYAPEVIYYGGSFYMYTSPKGHGHYVLKSDSPTGPFTAVTGNLGLTIDGSVFIEDDGSLFFYRAEFGGIVGHTMNSPTSMCAGSQLNANMNGWTEGPCVVKRNDRYYMQYTGNHVLAPTYRINYAMSSQGPLSGFEPFNDLNPYILNTEGDFIGLGHGSMFIGPDLDSHYVTYHNKAGDFGVGPLRLLNFDRVAWNDEVILVLGATNFDKPVPQMPDFYEYFESNLSDDRWETVSGNWMIANEGEVSVTNLSGEREDILLVKQIPLKNYTAEFNIRTGTWAGNSSYYGVVFDYGDANNYGVIAFVPDQNKLEVKYKQNGNWTDIDSIVLNGVADYSKWHAIRLEKYNNLIKVYVDNMKKAEVEPLSEIGSIGLMAYQTVAHFGYCAYTNNVDGRSVFNAWKPIPGNIAAVHYNQGANGYGYFDNQLLSEENFRGDSANVIAYIDGGFALGTVTAGNWYNYNLNVGIKGQYISGIKYAAKEECEIRFSDADGILLDNVILPATKSNVDYQTFITSVFELNAGLTTVKLEVVKGSLSIYNLAFEEFTQITDFSDTFGSSGSEWNYKDGNWEVMSKTLRANETGKHMVGDTRWNNYVVETDVKYLENINAGIVFRVKNPGQGGIGDDPQLGTDFFQGYYFSLTENGAVLGKQNYNWKELAFVPGNYYIGEQYHLKVEVNGANIKAYVDDMATPIIDYTDPTPFITGKAGLRSFQTKASFDNFMVYDINAQSSIVVEGAIYMISSPYSDLFLAQGEGGQLIQESYDEVESHLWKAVLRNDYWAFQNIETSQVFAVDELNDQEGANIIITDPSAKDNIFWEVIRQNDGFYSIINKQNKLSLTAEDIYLNEEAFVVQDNFTDSENQKWRFTMIDPNDLPTGIIDLEEVTVQICPNPATDFFEVKANHPIQEVLIFDLTGSLVERNKVNKENTFQINCTLYNKGMYLVRVILENCMPILKVVVK